MHKLKPKDNYEFWIACKDLVEMHFMHQLEYEVFNYQYININKLQTHEQLWILNRLWGFNRKIFYASDQIHKYLTTNTLIFMKQSLNIKTLDKV